LTTPCNNASTALLQGVVKLHPPPQMTCFARPGPHGLGWLSQISGLGLVDANFIFRYLTCLRQPGSIFEISRLIIAARDHPRGDTEREPVQATHSSLNSHFSSQVPVQSISSPRFCTKSIFSLTSSLSHELPRPQRGETRTPYFCCALWHQLARRRW